MDPQLLLPIVAPIAIALIVLVSWRLGGLRTAVLAGEEAALERLQADYPDFQAAETLLSADRRAALLSGGRDGRLALVASLGDRYLTRTLAPGDVRGAAIEDGGEGPALVMRLDDFTCPAVRLALPDRAAGEAWLERLRALGGRA